MQKASLPLSHSAQITILSTGHLALHIFSFSSRGLGKLTLRIYSGSSGVANTETTLSALTTMLCYLGSGSIPPQALRDAGSLALWMCENCHPTSLNTSPATPSKSSQTATIPALPAAILNSPECPLNPASELMQSRPSRKSSHPNTAQSSSQTTLTFPPS